MNKCQTYQDPPATAGHYQRTAGVTLAGTATTLAAGANVAVVNECTKHSSTLWVRDDTEIDPAYTLAIGDVGTWSQQRVVRLCIIWVLFLFMVGFVSRNINQNLLLVDLWRHFYSKSNPSFVLLCCSSSSSCCRLWYW